MLAWRSFGKLNWDTHIQTDRHTHTHTHTHTHIYIYIYSVYSHFTGNQWKLGPAPNLEPLLKGCWCRRKTEILCVGFRGALGLVQQRKSLLVSAWVQRRTGVVTWLGMPVAEKMQLRKPGVFKWPKNKERSFSPKWREEMNLIRPSTGQNL